MEISIIGERKIAPNKIKRKGKGSPLLNLPPWCLTLKSNQPIESTVRENKIMIVEFMQKEETQGKQKKNQSSPK